MIDVNGTSIPLRYWEGKENLEKGCPWWVPGAIAYMQAYIPPNSHILELGAGGSTIFFAQRSTSVISLESNAAWFDSVQGELQRKKIRNVELLLIPTESGQVDYIKSFPDESFDCILVDSHKSLDRGVLANCAASKLKYGGRLIIDNYSWLERNFFRYHTFANSPEDRQQSIFNVGACWQSCYFNDPHWMGQGTAVYQKLSFRQVRNQLLRSCKSIIKRSPFRGCAFALSRLYKKIRMTQHLISVSPTLQLTVTAPFKNYTRSLDRNNSCFDRFLELLDGTTVFFDVGAHVGLYSLAALKATNNRVAVHAFEPNRLACKALLRHFKLNNCKNGVISSYFIGANSGVIDFFEGPLPLADRSGFTPPTDEISDYHRPMFTMRKVLTTSLDLYCDSLNVYPDLIKIDTEGAELAVLQGALRLLSTVRPKIILSVHSDKLDETNMQHLSLIKLIDNQGYYLIDDQGNQVHELESGEYLMLPMEYKS